MALQNQKDRWRRAELGSADVEVMIEFFNNTAARLKNKHAAELLKKLAFLSFSPKCRDAQSFIDELLKRPKTAKVVGLDIQFKLSQILKTSQSDMNTSWGGYEVGIITELFDQALEKLAKTTVTGILRQFIKEYKKATKPATQASVANISFDVEPTITPWNAGVTVNQDLNAVASRGRTGGIDIRSLELEFKRDENNMPLPIINQPPELINIEGLMPFIRNYMPVNIPALLNMSSTDDKGFETSQKRGSSYKPEVAQAVR